MKESPQGKLKRLVARYPKIFKGQKLSLSKLKGMQGLEFFEQGDNVVSVFDSNRDAYYFVLLAIMKEGRYPSIGYFSSQELIDIYLGGNEDIPSISSLNYEWIAVVDWDGIPNKQKGNIIIQVLEDQRLKGRKSFYFYSKSKSQLNRTHPELVTYLEGSSVLHSKSTVDIEDDEDII